MAYFHALFSPRCKQDPPGPTSMAAQQGSSTTDTSHYCITPIPSLQGGMEKGVTTLFKNNDMESYFRAISLLSPFPCKHQLTVSDFQGSTSPHFKGHSLALSGKWITYFIPWGVSGLRACIASPLG